MLMLRPRAILQSLFEAAIAAADPAQFSAGSPC
jgi:hypothetical protein